MLTLQRVAITGSLASGKSTVCQFFEEWGAYVVRADQLLHREFSADTDLRRQICRLFGDEILVGSTIDRQRIAEMIVRTPKVLPKLESVCHPFVNREIQRQFVEACQLGTFSLFVAEVPLLFESAWSLHSWFDTTVVVVSDREISKERYLQSGGTAEQFDFREARQMSASEKIRRAAYTLVNNGTRAELYEKARTLYGILTNP